MELEELLKRKKAGDWVVGGKKLKITPDNFKKAIIRVGSKHHNKAVKVLTNIIIKREQLNNENMINY